MYLNKFCRLTVLSTLLCFDLMGLSYTIDSGDHILFTGSQISEIDAIGPTSNTSWFFLVERENAVLSQDVTVDGVNITDGAYNSPGDLNEGTLLQNSVVNSYFMFSHPSGGTRNYSGQITFVNEIIAIQYKELTIELPVSNAELARPGVTYDIGTFNLNTGADDFVISNGGHTIQFSMTTGTNMDNLRIITGAPEPKAYLILGGAVAAIGFFSYRRKRKSIQLQD